MKKLRKSFKEMTETMKNLQEFFMSKADLPGISLKVYVYWIITYKFWLLCSVRLTDSNYEKTAGDVTDPGPGYFIQGISYSCCPLTNDDTLHFIADLVSTGFCLYVGGRTPREKTEEELASYECCFETEDSDGNNEYTVFVRGLDTSLPRDEIKKALRKHFESCGCEVTRVFVPIECETGAPLGFATCSSSIYIFFLFLLKDWPLCYSFYRFAFIDVDDEQKAL